MKMNKMLLFASMALVAIAFAAPAAVQANVELTDPNNVTLKAKDKVTLTSTDLVTVTAKGNVECSRVTIHSEVVTNGLTHVVLKQIGAADTQGCSLNAGGAGKFPVTFKDWTVGVGEESLVTINTWGTLNTNATMIWEMFKDAGHKESLNRCHFSGKVHAVGAASGSDVLNVPGSGLVGKHEAGMFECHKAMEIKGSFTIETADDPATEVTDEVPVTLDFKATG